MSEPLLGRCFGTVMNSCDSRAVLDDFRVTNPSRPPVPPTRFLPVVLLAASRQLPVAWLRLA